MLVNIIQLTKWQPRFCSDSNFVIYRCIAQYMWILGLGLELV